MSRLARWANAVAWAGTRAIAPPRTRSWATRSGAVEACRCSTIASVASRSTVSTSIVWDTAVGWKPSSWGG
jgi:hypothetical protein